MSRKRIGELLLTRGLVNQTQLNQALAVQAETEKRLGQILVELGHISEEELATALSDSLLLPRVDLSQITVDWSAVHLLKPQLCESRCIFPFAMENVSGRRQLVLAMADPLDVRSVEEVEFTTGLKVSSRVASLSSIRAAILRYYHRVKGPSPAAHGVPLPPPAISSEKAPSIRDDLDFLLGEKASAPSRSAVDSLARLLIQKGFITQDEWERAKQG